MIVQLDKGLILEAVHSNHPNLDKRDLNNQNSRKELLDKIKSSRKVRDTSRKREDKNNSSYEQMANSADNTARALSQTGDQLKKNANFLGELMGYNKSRTKLQKATNYEPTSFSGDHVPENMPYHNITTEIPRAEKAAKK